jgi:hypothetical protein
MPVPNYQFQPNYGQKVTFSQYSVTSMVIAAWGADWSERDTVYEWSNGRYMEDSLQGPYDIAGE